MLPPRIRQRRFKRIQRRQGRALQEQDRDSQAKADPLFVHPDVRRMLMQMRAWNEAARALVALTDPPGNPAVLAELRMEALNPLIEMARWKTPEHARPAFTLVGRIAGLTEGEMETAFLRDERERVVAAARGRR